MAKKRTPANSIQLIKRFSEEEDLVTIFNRQSLESVPKLNSDTPCWLFAYDKRTKKIVPVASGSRNTIKAQLEEPTWLKDKKIRKDREHKMKIRGNFWQGIIST